ncbi:MAG: cytochrome C oxidase subunit IV family protein [Actinobacteria bacterium]|nr:cytochrome C oxidase subunit IV family protein [Actinomycetota bacterium]MDA3017359.1 cytochrome C oxidase subunit IV family protein [Actinomycetota bacterium]
MTIDTAETADEQQHGMTDAGYIRIAIILAAITGLEVSTYYVDFGVLFLPALLIMMVIKFVMVVSYFMHLKFDNKMFSFMFYAGLVLAVGVYAAFLATFKFFIQ